MIETTNSLSKSGELNWSEACRQAIVTIIVFSLITIPFAFTWVNEELFEFNKIILVYFLCLALIGMWATKVVSKKQLAWQPTFFDLPIALFVASQILSTVFSIHPHTSIFGYYTRFHGGLLSTLAYATLYWVAVQNIKPTDIWLIVKTIVISGLLIAAYAIPEHFGHSPSCWLISSSIQGVGTFDVSCWVQDVQNRIFGTFGQPNWLAAYVVLIWPIIVSFSWKKWHKLDSSYWQIIGLLSSLLLWATLLFTQSRSGLLGLLTAVIVSCFGALIISWQKISKLFSAQKEFKFSIFQTKTWTVPITLVIGMTVILLWFGSVFSPAVSKVLAAAKMDSQPTPANEVAAASTANSLELGGSSSGEIRKIVWQGAINIWQRYPIFGSGVETFAYSYYPSRPMEHNLVSEWDFLYNKAHNELLNFLATTGIVGLTAYLILTSAAIFWPLVAAWKINRENIDALANNKTNYTYFLIAISAGIAGLTVSNFFGFSTVAVTWLQFLLLACSAVITTQQDKNKIDKQSTSLQNNSANKQLINNKIENWQWLVLAGVWLIVSYGWLTVYKMWKADYHYARGQQFLQQSNVLAAANSFELAINNFPNEAIFYDGLSTAYAVAANALHTDNDATAAAQLAQASLALSDHAINLNPHHVNLYKNRYRTLTYLGEVDPLFYSLNLENILQAQQLAPTDPRLVYNQAILELKLAATESAVITLQKALQMKPNYEAARSQLANIYIQQQKPVEAIAEYEYILQNIAPGKQEFIDKIQALQ